MTAHCCEMMRSNVENTCDQHVDRRDCPDCLIEYRIGSNEYGIMVHDGGQSMIGIEYCPWCGSALREVA